MRKYHGKDLSTNDFTDGYKKKIDSMQTLYRFKGTVDTVNDLSTIEDRNIGDTYKCKANSNTYIWNGTEWINAGQDVDYSEILEQIDTYQEEVNTQINNITEHKYTQKITESIEAGTAFTIPCSYKVGQDVLDVYLNGEKLIKSSDNAGTDGHYQEVGEANNISNQIKTTTDWSLETGDILEFIVRGDYSDTE